MKKNVKFAKNTFFILLFMLYCVSSMSIYVFTD